MRGRKIRGMEEGMTGINGGGSGREAALGEEEEHVLGHSLNVRIVLDEVVVL